MHTGVNMSELLTDILIKRYETTDKAVWDAFIDASKTPMFMFKRDYMDYHKDRFRDHSLMFYKENKLIAVLPASEKEKCLFSHGGLTYGGLIIGNDTKQQCVCECFYLLQYYLKKNDISEMIYKTIPHIFHKQPAEEDLYALYRVGGIIKSITASTVIDLQNPLSMKKGRKAQISRAKREGVTVKRLENRNDYYSFMELEDEVLQSRHNVKSVHSCEEMFMLHERFPDNIHLYGAIFDNHIIAGVIIFEYENVIHTQYMAANDKARTIGALDLTIARIIEEYAKTKKWLDFGISTEDEGNYLNQGLISQKEGFGGRTNIYCTLRLSM